MARRILGPVVISSALLLAGCGSLDASRAVVIVDGVESGPCAFHSTPGPGPFLQCPTAVDLAANKLGVLPGTPSATEFHLGVLCPPNARCLAQTDVGTIVVWFDEAPPVMVRITFVVSGGFVAQAPETPPQWLIDQGQAGAGGT
jgi:hypothetical protein